MGLPNKMFGTYRATGLFRLIDQFPVRRGHPGNTEAVRCTLLIYGPQIEVHVITGF